MLLNMQRIACERFGSPALGKVDVGVVCCIMGCVATTPLIAAGLAWGSAGGAGTNGVSMVSISLTGHPGSVGRRPSGEA